MLLLFTQLSTAVFILLFELIDKESNFTADRVIYCAVYLHNIDDDRLGEERDSVQMCQRNMS